MFGAVDSVSAAWRQSVYPAQSTVTRGAPVSSAEPARESVGSSAASAAGGTRGASAGALPFGPSEMPYVPQGYGPVELATRTRIRFSELGAQPLDDALEGFPGLSDDAEDAAKQALFPGTKDEEENPGSLPGASEGEENDKVAGAKESKSAADEMQEAKCETCEKRKYQDGSDDPGVSFKNPTRVSPRLAQSAVRGHEMEHVVRERAKAQREGRRVISQNVTYHTAICPECGRMYIAGGTTRTVTAADNYSDYLDDLANGENGFDIAT